MTAVAIFVKTPGLSPVKTRLAKAIGFDASEAPLAEQASLARWLYVLCGEARQRTQRVADHDRLSNRG